MQTAVGVELFCSRCTQETSHQASITDGHLHSLRCLGCGATTTVRPQPVASSPVPQPLPEIRVGRAQIGPGRLILEGGIALPAAPFMRQAMAAVRAGRALRELDCKVLRLSAQTEEQLRLVLTVKASTGLPVLADIGGELSLAPHVPRCQADGLIFTCTDPGQAEEVGHAISPSFPGLAVIRTTGENLCDQVDTAAAAVRTLCRWYHRNLAVTFQVANAAHFSIASRLLLDRVSVPIRAEFPMAGESGSQIVHTAAAMGAACNQPGVAIAGLPAFDEKTRVAYDVAAEVLAQLGDHHLVERDTLGAFVYIASKAFGRVVTKPGRLLHEMEFAPDVFARSLPGRLVSKPGRVFGEIRRLLHKIS